MTEATADVREAKECLRRADSLQLPYAMVPPAMIRTLIAAAEPREPDRDAQAYRMAYAPLRSAQHALDIIGRQASSYTEAAKLAREESKRIGQALFALGEQP